MLYSPEILAAAVRLSEWTADPALPLAGEARSRSCGSTLALRLSVDDQGKVVRAGCRAQACAVGQAAASLFLAHAPGRDLGEITAAREAIARWLEVGGNQPGWPGLALIEPARGYPARHGAILLAWDAAIAALAPAPAVR